MLARRPPLATTILVMWLGLVLVVSGGVPRKPPRDAGGPASERIDKVVASHALVRAPLRGLRGVEPGAGPPLSAFAPIVATLVTARVAVVTLGPGAGAPAPRLRPASSAAAPRAPPCG